MLDQVSHEKVLGVQIDNNLLWSTHINFITKKISRNTWLLSQISKYLPLNYRITFYKSFIQPHVDYCNIVWASVSKSNLNRIERLQKRACKIILDYDCENGIQAMADLHIMTVHERILLRKAKFMYKVSKGIAPQYITDLFEHRNTEDETFPVLRSTTSDNFLLPKPRIQLFKNSLSYSGPVIWNCLPMNVKISPSVASFHKACLTWMQNTP